jgi:hypothetical protein
VAAPFCGLRLDYLLLTCSIKMDRIVFNIVEKPSKNIKDVRVGPLVSDEEMVDCVKLE